jgi:hypothetical protein
MLWTPPVGVRTSSEPMGSARLDHQATASTPAAGLTSRSTPSMPDSRQHSAKLVSGPYCTNQSRMMSGSEEMARSASCFHFK